MSLRRPMPGPRGGMLRLSGLDRWAGRNFAASHLRPLVGQLVSLCRRGWVLPLVLAGLNSCSWGLAQPPRLPLQTPPLPTTNPAVDPDTSVPSTPQAGSVPSNAAAVFSTAPPADEPLKIRQVYVPESRLVEFMQGRPAYLPLSAEKFREILAGNEARTRVTCRGEPIRHALIIGPGGSLQGQSLVRLRAFSASGMPLASLPTGPSWVEFDQWTVPAEYFNLVPQVSAVRDVARETGRDGPRSSDRDASRPAPRDPATRDQATSWAGFFPPGVSWQEVPVSLSVNEQGSFGLPLSQASEWMLVRYNLALATQSDFSGRRQLRLPNLPSTLTTVLSSGSAPTSFFLNGATNALHWVPTAAEVADAEKRTSRKQYFGESPEVIGQFMEFDRPPRIELQTGRYAERSSLTVERTVQRFEGVVDLELGEPYAGELVLELPADLQVTRCEVNGVSQACHVRSLDAGTRQWVLPWQLWTARHEIRVAGVLNVDTPERIVIPRLRVAGHTWMSGAVQVAIAAPLTLVDYELIDGRILRSQALGRVQDLSFQWGSPDGTVTLLLEVPVSAATVAITPETDFTRLTAEPEKLEADQYLLLDDRFRDSNVVTWEVAEGWQIEQVAAFDPALLQDNADQPLPESGLTPLNWSLLWENDRPKVSVVLPAESRENRLGLRLSAVQPVSQWPIEVSGRLVQEIGSVKSPPRACVVQVVSTTGIRPASTNGREWSALTMEDARQRLPELRGLIGAGILRHGDSQTRLMLENAAGQSGGYDVLAHTYNRLLPNGVVEQGHRFLIQPNGPLEELRLSGGGDARTARRWQTISQAGQVLEHELGPATDGAGWSLRFRRPVNDPFVLVVQQTWVAESDGPLPLYQFPYARQFQGGIDSTSNGPYALQIHATEPLTQPADALRQFRFACRQWWRDGQVAIDTPQAGNSNLPSTYSSTWYTLGSELRYQRVTRLEWASPTLMFTRQIDTWQSDGWQTELQLEVHCDAATRLSVVMPDSATFIRARIKRDTAPEESLQPTPQLDFPSPGRYTAEIIWTTRRPTTSASWSGWESLPPAHPLLPASVTTYRELRLPTGVVPQSVTQDSDSGVWSLGQRLLSPLIWPRHPAATLASTKAASWLPLESDPSGYQRWQWTRPESQPDNSAWSTRDSTTPTLTETEGVPDSSATLSLPVGEERQAAEVSSIGELSGATVQIQTDDPHPPVTGWAYRSAASHRWHWTALLCGCVVALALRRCGRVVQPTDTRADSRGINIAIIGGVALAWLLPWPWHEWVASVWWGVLLGDAWYRLWSHRTSSQVGALDRRAGEASTRSASLRRALTPTGVAWMLGIGCWSGHLYAAGHWPESPPLQTNPASKRLQDEDTSPEARPYPMVVVPVDEEQRPVGPVVYVPPDLYAQLNRSPSVDRGSFDLERRGAQHTLEFDPQLRRFSRLTSLYTCKASTAKTYLLPSPVGPEHAIRQVRLNGVPVLFQRLRDGVTVQMDVGTNLLSITYDLRLTQSRLQLDQHGLIDSYVVLSGVPNSWQTVVTDSRYPQTRFHSPIQRRFRTDRFRGTRIEVFPETENWSNPTIETWLSFDPLQVRCETRLRLGSAVGLRNELWFQVDPRLSLPASYSTEATTWMVERVPEEQRPTRAKAGPVYRLQWSENHNPEQILRIPWEYQSQSFGRLIPPTWMLLDAELPRFRHLLVVQVDSRLVFRTLELDDSHFRRGNELELMSIGASSNLDRESRGATNSNNRDNSPDSAASIGAAPRTLGALIDNLTERNRSILAATNETTNEELSFRNPNTVRPTSEIVDAIVGAAVQPTNPGLDPTSRMAATASNLFVYEQVTEMSANHLNAIGRLSLQPTQVIGNLNQDLILSADSATLLVRGELQVTHGELSQALFQLPPRAKLQRLALLSAQQNEVAWVAPRRGSESDGRAAFLRTPLQGTVRVELDLELTLSQDQITPLPWVQLPGFSEVNYSVQVQDPNAAWQVINESGEPAFETETTSNNPPILANAVRFTESAERLRAFRLQPSPGRSPANDLDATRPDIAVANAENSIDTPAESGLTTNDEPEGRGILADDSQLTAGDGQPEILAGRFVLGKFLDLRHCSETEKRVAIAQLAGLRAPATDADLESILAGVPHDGIIAGWQQLVVRNRGLDRLTLVIPPGWSVLRAWRDGSPVLAVPGPAADPTGASDSNTKTANPLATIDLDPLQGHSLLTLELVGVITPERPELRWISPGTTLSLACESTLPVGWPPELRLETAGDAATLPTMASSPEGISRILSAATGPSWGTELPAGHSMAGILQRPWPESPANEEAIGPAISLAPAASVEPLPAASPATLLRWMSGIALLGLVVWLSARKPGAKTLTWRWPGRAGTAPIGRDLFWWGLAATVWTCGGALPLSALFAALGLVFFLERLAQLGFLRRFA